jgi:TRAP-type transport system small permease protein
MKKTFGLQTIERFLNNVLGAILVMGMMFLIVVDVSGRYLFNKPLQGTMELVIFIMAGIVFLTIGHTQAVKGHIKVEVLLEFISPRSRKVLELVAYCVGLGIWTLIAWQGMALVKDAWNISEVTDGLIPFSTLPAKLTVPIGSILLCLRFICDIAATLKKLKGKETSS